MSHGKQGRTEQDAQTIPIRRDSSDAGQGGNLPAVTAVQPGSLAARAGIEPGSVILRVNRKDVRNAADFKKALNESKAAQRVLMLIRKGDAQRYVALSW